MANGYILVISKNHNQIYYHYKTKKMAEDDAERFKGCGYDMMKIIPAPAQATIYTKEGKQ